MSEHTTESQTAPTPQSTPVEALTDWQRMPSADPIEILDPLADLLGMVPPDEPLVFTFADVAKHAGHACPAVAGGFRSTQLALEALYPDSYPVRSEIEVVVEDGPEEMGVGPMASVIGHITGAARETGFTGIGGFGGRKNLLSFENADDAGRSFTFYDAWNGTVQRVLDASPGQNSPFTLES